MARPTQRVGEAELGEHQVERRQHRLIGDHHPGEDQDEEHLLERDGEAGQRVAGGDGEHEAEDDGEGGDGEAVADVGPEAGLVVGDGAVVVEAERVGQVSAAAPRWPRPAA